MTSKELYQLMQTHNFTDKNHIIDVREDSEWHFNRLPFAYHYPLARLAFDYIELPKDKQLIVYCHHGIRSQQACQLLNQLSFDMVENLTGGIHNWAVMIDPTMKLY